MNDWLQNQLDAGLADFSGLSVSARIPLRDALVNQLIAGALRDAAGRDYARPPAPGTIDFRALLKFVDKAEIHTSDGVVVAEVVINVP
jgi:hypothetical protein